MKLSTLAFVLGLATSAGSTIALCYIAISAEHERDAWQDLTERCEADYSKFSLEHFCETCKAHRTEMSIQSLVLTGSHDFECIKSVLDIYGTRIIDDCDTGLSVELPTR